MPLGKVRGQAWCPPRVRREALNPVEAGLPVVDVARHLEISGQSICAWRRQGRRQGAAAQV